MNTSNSTTVTGSTATIIVAAVFVLVIAIVAFTYFRRREQEFAGEVIDKNIIETTNNTMPSNDMNQGTTIVNSGIQHTYKIKVKTATGKTVNYKVSSGMYEKIQIGDTVSKSKGTTDITIVSTAKSA